jgi:hypothetical protein
MKPRTLVVIADGPRGERPGEIDVCNRVRAIVEKIDWPCELLKNYADTNLGCGIRVKSGLDWAFQKIEQAIILEDDCLPDLSFFRFCNELLERYRNDERVMQISGSNFLFGRQGFEESYYFSSYPLGWGWATWRRAWNHFDFEMRSWSSGLNRFIDKFEKPSERAFWKATYDDLRGRLDIWDYQWALTCIDRDGLCVTPATNLVENIGFGAGATHTKSRLAAMRPAVAAMHFPLRHPSRLEPNAAADEFTAQRFFYSRSRVEKGIEAIKRRWLALESRWRRQQILRTF